MPDAPEGWVPEFEGQRPPFQPGNELAFKPGNTAATKSGAWSQRAIGPVAEALVEAVLDDEGLDYLHQLRFRPALVAWAAAEARVAVLERWMSEMSMAERLRSSKGSTSFEEQLRKLDVNALTHRARLGLDPLSAAKLGKDVAQGKATDTARIMAELHRDQREREQANP
jgi:hypothetical protein